MSCIVGRPKVPTVLGSVLLGLPVRPRLTTRGGKWLILLLISGPPVVLVMPLFGDLRAVDSVVSGLPCSLA